jgi:hypothetical protein
MSNYYLQIVKDNVSILIDSDIGYHHHFKIDDVIEVLMDDSLRIFITGRRSSFFNSFTLSTDGWVVKGKTFIIDWNKKDYKHLSIASAIMKGYMIDITKVVERDDKLKELGV